MNRIKPLKWATTKREMTHRPIKIMRNFDTISLTSKRNISTKYRECIIPYLIPNLENPSLVHLYYACACFARNLAKTVIDSCSILLFSRHSSTSVVKMLINIVPLIVFLLPISPPNRRWQHVVFIVVSLLPDLHRINTLHFGDASVWFQLIYFVDDTLENEGCLS